MAIIYNEFEHVLHLDQPVLARISCMLLVLTVGNSIAVNVTRVLRWKYQRLEEMGPGLASAFVRLDAGQVVRPIRMAQNVYQRNGSRAAIRDLDSAPAT